MGADKEDVFNRTSEEQGETVDEQCCSALSSALLDLWKCISTTQSWDVGLTIVRLLSHNGGAEVDFTLSSLSFAASARFLRLAKDSRSHSDMVVDPLLVLRVRKEVLTHPPLIRIILDILKGYMVASRSHLYEKYVQLWYERRNALTGHCSYKGASQQKRVVPSRGVEYSHIRTR